MPQLTHAAPPTPHVDTLGAWQLPLGESQQPFWHEVALHTQAPVLHCGPAWHAGPVAPQPHTPLLGQK